MCIRDSLQTPRECLGLLQRAIAPEPSARVIDGGVIADGYSCLLYTSDAADERSSGDLGGSRIIKKKNNA